MAKRKKQTQAEILGIQSGKLGDVVDGITISEANRATVYDRWVNELLTYQHNYSTKGVRSIIYGVKPKKGSDIVYYAIFCEDGFITNE